ncbi:MAG: alpha/beta fold hydrolase [Bacteroidales bacterium]|nr:alpha/beta fold hydrolase [Bacteroidales bacterium]MDD3521708.1 alpha/beta fold hydrolase [Bacteroidales bacterium]MDD4030989.1 alpha/beta fold hydrolase [Bacteroidales bacterium]MDD4435736.1 alpha/beta fold hydrolase [Bacteroidales bacterium]
MNKKNKKKTVLGIILGVVLLIIGSLVTIPILVMNSIVNRHVDFEEVWTAEEFGLEAEHFFVTTEDGLRISAYEVSVENPRAVIICISGIHNPSVTAFFGHARLFSENQYATILFDMRAHGESEGDMICLGYKEYLDVKAIVKHIKEDPSYQDTPIVVLGVSMGGVTAINATGEIPGINGLISIAAYSAWEDVFYELMTVQAPVFLAKMVRPFVPLVTVLKYKVNICKIKPVREIQKLGNRPALIMHTTGDSQVPFASFERIIRHAPSHVKTFIREGDMHFMTENFTEPEKDTEYAATILGFLDRMIL